ncbi:MAG: UDP-3-O-(3-hydroxymyristoyl)glucosamine N-acyltransferase [Phycisphaeraceae bacterium]|nr:MAG: UDP-3-O-(3-hydroxymyristoyl)glucosamine N-acyltransferase [Phycisphaeraceae bacterium]
MSTAGPSFTTSEVAALIGAELRGATDLRLDRLDPLELAGPSSLTFIRSDKYAKRWRTSKAGAAIVTRELVPDILKASQLADDRALLLVDNADLALIRILDALDDLLPVDDNPAQGRCSSAIIHATAEIDPTACIGLGVTIGPRTIVSAGVVLQSGVVLGSDVRVGPQTEIRANAVIQARTVIGAKCLIHPGVVIGSDGFGFRPDPSGAGVVKIPHVGHVEIGDDVEIGANSTIDRGKFGPTRIGSGTKIDNLVQIGHNCTIGRACLICGCAGIGGSTSIGDGAMIGGGVGLRDNIKIGAGAQVAAMSGVMGDIPAGEIWFGFPAKPSKRAMRTLAALDRLADILGPMRKMLRDHAPPSGSTPEARDAETSGSDAPERPAASRTTSPPTV